MNVLYKIYGNDGHGGPINYDVPIGTTDQLSYSLALPESGSDFSFAVRASDAATGLTEANTDAVVRLILDDAGNDVTGAPASPRELTLNRRGAGPLIARWYWRPGFQNDRVTHFQIRLVRVEASETVLADERVNGSAATSLTRWLYEGEISPGTYRIEVTAFNGDLPSRDKAQATTTTGISRGVYRIDNLRVRSGTGPFPRV